MRLTKRQLKRIIREEYSRLKRRGLIKETFEDEMFERGGGDYDQLADDLMQQFPDGCTWEEGLEFAISMGYDEETYAMAIDQISQMTKGW